MRLCGNHNCKNHTKTWDTEHHSTCPFCPTEQTFGGQFPSLVEHGCDKHDSHISMYDVKAYCLDKQRVREAFERLIDAEGAKPPHFKIFEKEVGL
jgi:hypothetical protein